MYLELEKNLNPSQLEAVTSTSGPVLVIAGAGSGKTRTIVYRLAHLVDKGVDPESILLLTFTRKASQEMLTRASFILGQGLDGIAGGTFHSFAFSILRRYSAAMGYTDGFTIMDRGDAEDILKQVKESHEFGKGDRSFPKKSTIMGLISKSRNKELSIKSLLESDSSHMLRYADTLAELADRYADFKFEHGLMDYDDLLFKLEALLLERPDITDFLRFRSRHIMVDEYQDTNLVQGRLLKLLAGEAGNLMVVGDDAQSIYSFRGATVSNILRFREDFPEAKIIKLEQNYRSVQPILQLSNQILIGAKEKYEKHLFSSREDGGTPELIRPLSDLSQARVVLERIRELSRDYPLHDMAVLFRSGFQSYPLEVALNKEGIAYRKYGGLKFTEAAHIKDVLAHLRLVLNPTDLPAWQRAVSLIGGVGPKTSQRLYQEVCGRGQEGSLQKVCAKNRQMQDFLDLLSRLRQNGDTPYATLQSILEYYRPLFEDKYPDDYPRRQAGLDQLSQIAAGYDDLDVFLTEMALENPDQLGDSDPLQDYLILSTVHSAKGLEWSAVIVIDLVEERFPSKHALVDAENMEEERRLFYVACTRAKDYLGLSMPESLFNRFQNRSEPAVPSPFVQEFPGHVIREFREGFSGSLDRKASAGGSRTGKAVPDEPLESSRSQPSQLGYCRHRIFGRGKVVSFLPPNKYQVNFPGFGLKIILGDYLQLEE